MNGIMILPSSPPNHVLVRQPMMRLVRSAEIPLHCGKGANSEACTAFVGQRDHVDDIRVRGEAHLQALDLRRLETLEECQAGADRNGFPETLNRLRKESNAAMHPRLDARPRTDPLREPGPLAGNRER